MPLDQGRMKGFVASLLAESGGLVGPIEPDGLEVLTTPAIQQALGVGEFCRLGFGATLPENAVRVGIESDWLSRLDRVLGPHGRWTQRVVAPPPRKAPDVEAALSRHLVLDNATARLLESAPAWTRYLVLDFRYTALSDEKREGTCRLSLNLATGALTQTPFDASAAWSDGAHPAALPEDAELPPDWERARVIARMRQALPWRVETALAPFVAGLRRRLTRDLDRLHAYHNDLHREAQRRSAQAGAGELVQQREALRMAAIGHEYRAKLGDLAHKYALRISADWVQTQDVVMPVHRLKVQIRRRKADRIVMMDWNMHARRLELPPCEASFSTERPRLVCDDELHFLAQSGLAPCEGCGRPYCRACHTRQCPKCSRAGGISAFSGVGSRKEAGLF